MIKQKHGELTMFQKQHKLMLINQLCLIDEDFEIGLRKLMKRAFKKCPELAKIISTEDMTEEERLDMNNPIES